MKTENTSDTRSDCQVAAETLAALFASLKLLRVEITGAHAAIDRTPGESGKVHEWAHVALTVTFHRPEHRTSNSAEYRPSASFSTPYKMGVGLINWGKLLKSATTSDARYSYSVEDKRDIEVMAKSSTRLTATAQRDIVHRFLKHFVSAVNPAEVLARVCADGREAGETTFEDWCANCGSDPDSRSAEATYLLCQKQGNEARRLVGGVAFVKLADLANQL